jgi:hypothetical protein
MNQKQANYFLTWKTSKAIGEVVLDASQAVVEEVELLGKEH